MNKILLVLAAAGLLAACAGDGAGNTGTPDGSKVNLSDSPRGLVTASTPNGELTGYNQNHSFYGFWKDNTSSRYELKAQGEAAYDVPKSGVATYHGSAMRLNHTTGEFVTDGTSRINVDFGNRTVDGKLTLPGAYRDVTLHRGSLNGNDYSGRASVIGNANGSYEGKLFGKGAKETAGVVEFDNNALDTVFGGVRY